MAWQERGWTLAFGACTATAVIAPVVTSRYILNEIVPCSFARLVRFDLEGVFTNSSVPAGLYEALYGFGIAGEFVMLLSLTSAVISLYYAGSVLRDFWSIMRLIAAGIVMALLFYFVPFEYLSPHSCISEALVDLTASKLPEEETGIGNAGSSLKDVFEVIYRSVLFAGALAALCIAIVVGRITASIAFRPQSSVPTTVDDDDTNIAMNLITVLLFVISISFTIELMAAKHYFGTGGQLIADAFPGPSGLEVVAAYKTFTSAVLLHWGGVGSAVIGGVFAVAVAGIIVARDRRKLPWLPKQSQILRSLANLAAVSVPMVAATLQQYMSSAVV